MSISPEFSEIDWLCVNTVRLLSADMVQAANSGHPGAPMGLAPLAHVLFTRFLRFDPSDPNWVIYLLIVFYLVNRWEGIGLCCLMDMLVHCSTRCFICSDTM